MFENHVRRLTLSCAPPSLNSVVEIPPAYSRRSKREHHCGDGSVAGDGGVRVDEDGNPSSSSITRRLCRPRSTVFADTLDFFERVPVSTSVTFRDFHFEDWSWGCKVFLRGSLLRKPCSALLPRSCGRFPVPQIARFEKHGHLVHGYLRWKRVQFVLPVARDGET